MFRFAFSLLLICTSAQGFQQDTRSADSDREKDVDAIYSLMLTKPMTSHGVDNNERYLIAMTTGPGWPQEPCVQPPKEREAEFREVLTDYESRKATPRELKRELSISKPYELLSDAEVGELHRERSTGFIRPGSRSERFRGVTDLWTLTDAYFNQRGTLALTAISPWCGSTCALHLWKVFEKLDNGKWEELRWPTCFTIAENFGNLLQLAHSR
jgi:hypothetical protein